jgi:hypothetical protein
MVARVVQGSGLAGQDRAQLKHAFVGGSGPGIHQPVGVQREDRTRREWEGELAVDGGAKTDRQAGRQVRSARRAVGPGDDRREVPCPCYDA